MCIRDSRKGNKGLGFGAEIKTKKEKEKSDTLASIEPHDLVKYGLIPELVGRIPLITALSPLDTDALVPVSYTHLDCSCGKKGNTGKFCSECGKARPEGAWFCTECGAKNTGKFCSNCGKPRA